MKIYLVQYGCCEDCGGYYYIGYFTTKNRAIKAWEEFRDKEITKEMKSIDTITSGKYLELYSGLATKQWYLKSRKETIKLLEKMKEDDYLTEIEVKE